MILPLDLHCSAGPNSLANKVFCDVECGSPPRRSNGWVQMYTSSYTSLDKIKVVNRLHKVIRGGESSGLSGELTFSFRWHQPAIV